MVCGYVLLFLFDLKIENSKKYMFSGRLTVDHLYGKWLFMAVAGYVFVDVLFCAVLLR